MRRRNFLALAMGAMAWPAIALAQQSAPASPQPFTATLSNNTPLVFGMGVEDASQALGRPLSYVSGSSGNEVYLAIRNAGGSGLIGHNDRLYLQFRNGKLAGWKGDWSRNWMWQ
ncbi:hypothetical protein [Bradyrhizobium sp.]|jgi:hypothetical protein|uniref:hypothetical protein n=2 Tax=Bradyrhizobium sp. TaxID=376 RepID=UPI003C70167C